jgi:hypothetical protein
LWVCRACRHSSHASVPSLAPSGSQTHILRQRKALETREALGQYYQRQYGVEPTGSVVLCVMRDRPCAFRVRSAYKIDAPVLLHVTSGGSSAFTVTLPCRWLPVATCERCDCLLQATVKRSPSRSPTRTEASASVTSTPVVLGRSPAKPPTAPKTAPKVSLSATLPRKPLQSTLASPPTRAKRASVPNLRSGVDDTGIVPWQADDSLAVLDEQIAGEAAIASKSVASCVVGGPLVVDEFPSVLVFCAERRRS